jgi:hypothetical protein
MLWKYIIKVVLKGLTVVLTFTNTFSISALIPKGDGDDNTITFHTTNPWMQEQRRKELQYLNYLRRFRLLTVIQWVYAELDCKIVITISLTQ